MPWWDGVNIIMIPSPVVVVCSNSREWKHATRYLIVAINLFTTRPLTAGSWGSDYDSDYGLEITHTPLGKGGFLY